MKILLAFKSFSPLIERIVKQIHQGFHTEARIFILQEFDDSLDSEGRLPRSIQRKGYTLNSGAQSLLKNEHCRSDLQHSHEKAIVNIDKFPCLEGLLNASQEGKGLGLVTMSHQGMVKLAVIGESQIVIVITASLYGKALFE